VTKIVFATVTQMVFGPGDLRYNLREGDTWAAEDPLVQEYPDFFSDEPTRLLRTEPVSPTVAAEPAKPKRGLERATAGPGETRGWG